MKKLIASSVLLLTVAAAQAETFTIAGYTFDQASSIKTASIVEGYGVLEHRSNRNFGRFSEDYLRSPEVMVNEFTRFDRRRTVGCLLGHSGADSTARHVNFNTPPGTRVTLHLTWGAQGLPNRTGADFYVFESGRTDAFSVSVLKAGSSEFTPYRFKRPAREDKIHLVHATAFDLSEFGLTDGEVCSAIRIRNLRGTSARVGADKVDNASGEGMIVPPSHPEYEAAYPLLVKAGANGQAAIDELDPDIVYVVGQHNLVPLNQTDLVATAGK